MTTHPRLIVELPAAVALDAQTARSIIRAIRETAEIAAAHGVEALLLHDEAPALDPTVLAGYLTAAADVPLIVEARTGSHAPYNLARRVQTLARLTGGRVGVLLRATGLDPVTAASSPTVHLHDPARQLEEYATVLRRLWASFPESALLGDRHAGVFADTGLIVPAAHAGEAYSVSGPLNVPLRPEHAAVLFADAAEAGEGAVFDALIGDSAPSHERAVPVYRRVDAVPGGSGLPLVPPADRIVLRPLVGYDRLAGALASLLEASGPAVGVSPPGPLRAGFVRAVA